MDPKVRLQQMLDTGVVLSDGAMGTMLYSRGAFLNRCFEQLNLDDPEGVRAVHDAYVQAGVDLIETNTFGANRVRLAKYGLADQVEAINKAGVRLARQAAGDSVLVAGAMGPLGVDLDIKDQKAVEQASSVFAEQSAMLAEAGADLLILETFSNVDELLAAIRAAQATGLAMIAQITVGEDHRTGYGIRADQALARVAREEAVVAVGLNCSTGPASMLASLELVLQAVAKPVSVQPNAGMPRSIDGRTLYMCTPEYMAEYAKRFYQLGARIIGGCCGTTPEHIRQIVSAVRAMHKGSVAAARPRPVPKGAVQQPPAAAATPFAQRSNWAAKLAQGRWVTTVELTPPRGTDLGSLISKAAMCRANGVDAINIPDGPRASCRLSPMVTAMQIHMQVGIEPILHVCCRDRNLIGMQSDILGVYALGIRNLLIITGDPPKVGEYPDATGVFDLDSITLTRLVRDLNTGIDLAGNRFSPPTQMVIGIGANPAAVSLQKELDRFRQKVDAGAEYAVTQPVFDEGHLFGFLDRIQGLSIPVVAGIWPLTSLKSAEFMANEVPGVCVPQAVLERMARAKTKAEGLRTGVEIAMEMVDRIRYRVQGVAVSAPFGNVRVALAALGKLELDQI